MKLQALLAVALVTFGCRPVKHTNLRGSDAQQNQASEGELRSAAQETRIAAGSAPEVVVASGRLVGKRTERTDVFLGIPFAKPPLGELRWRAPQAPAAWAGARQATSYPLQCLQPGGLTTTPLSNSSEDCLYLNVWTPNGKAQNAALPVMVFLHGGGLLFGSTSSEPIYDGSNLAARGDLIVVTVQYRLGNLGFMAHPALTKESAYGGSGNYGLMDQIAALRWVQKNISAFGGDPAKVTLFGESGGGTSVCSLLASPVADPFFARAIIESQNCPFRPLVEAEKIGNELSAKVGCGSGTGAAVAACLRKKSPASLVTAAQIQLIDALDFSRSRYVPNLDGWILPEEPLVRFGSGAVRKPTIIGFNGSEGEVFVPLTVSPANVLAQAKKRYGAQAYDQLLALYPLAKYGNSAIKRSGAIMADHLFYCPARQVARRLEQGGAPVYKYLFAHTATYGTRAMPPVHAAELPFVFQNITLMSDASPKPADLLVQDLFASYWPSFAKTGDPNGPMAPMWDRYESVRDNHQTLDGNPRAEELFHGAECDLFDRLRGFN